VLLGFPILPEQASVHPKRSFLVSGFGTHARRKKGTDVPSAICFALTARVLDPSFDDLDRVNPIGRCVVGFRLLAIAALDYFDPHISPC
jgi:hypothetical protein